MHVVSARIPEEVLHGEPGNAHCLYGLQQGIVLQLSLLVHHLDKYLADDYS